MIVVFRTKSAEIIFAIARIENELHEQRNTLTVCRIVYPVPPI